MALLRVDNVGAAGFLPDMEHWQLDANAWTLVWDASFGENSALPPYLLDEFIRQDGKLEETIFLSIFAQIVSQTTWLILCTQQKVYATRGKELIDITPTGFQFAANTTERWQATSFNGFLVLNNNFDEPHYWPLDVTDEAVPRLRRLSDYPGSSPWPRGQSCKFIVGFNSALFAANITNASGNFPYLVIFSDFAEPGTLPQAWEPRPENSAGRRDLAEGMDEIVGGLPFKDYLFIRKRNSVVIFRYTGGQFVYQRKTTSEETSILNKHCVCNTDMFQFVVAENDMYITEGTAHQSVIKNRVKQWFFKNLNKAGLDKVFCLHHSIGTEIWVLAPQGDSRFCNMALIWNYTENTFTLRTCQNYLAGVETLGVLPSGFISWGDLVGSWADV